MPRPRKIAIAEENPPKTASKAATTTQKTQKAQSKATKTKSNAPNAAKKVKIDYELAISHDGKNLAQIILNLQKNSSNVSKTINDLKKVYEKMEHSEFFDVFKKVINAFLIVPETQSDNANKILKFIGSFVASYGEMTLPNDECHPLITSTFNEILSISSKLIHVRARICMLVAHIMTNFSPKAEIDENIIDNITSRMNGTFVRDPSPLVRQNALLALQRLQNPDDKDDAILKVYQFHMESDPVAKVRMTVITAIAKKLSLIPNIIERLQDIDEKVRRHVYLQMASFPVKTYRIIDRISFLEAGLNDRSEKVAEVVANVFLPNWISAYDKDYAELIKAIKMDSSDKELSSFRSLAEKALDVLFKKQPISELVEYLEVSNDSELPRCIPLEKTTSIEWLLIWKVVIKTYQRNVAGKAEEEKSSDASDHEDDEPEADENIVPELSVMCRFIERFAKDFKSGSENDAKYQNLLFNHSLIVLFEIVQLCDLSDVVGCSKIREIVKEVLTKNDVIELAIKKMTEVIQSIDTNPEVSLNYFNDVVFEMVGAGASEYSRQSAIDTLINKADMPIKIKANRLKMDMMDLKEKEAIFVDKKEYGKAQKVKEEYDQLEQQLHELLTSSMEATDETSETLNNIKTLDASNKKLSSVENLKNLRIYFFSLMGKGVKAINHRTLEIYNKFVRYHLESNEMLIRIWALKSATACSMLYESLSKEVLHILKNQIFNCTNVSVWETAITGITDLLLRYGIEKLEVNKNVTSDMTQNRSRRGGRTLYSNEEEEEENPAIENSIDVIVLINHMLDSEGEKPILQKASYIGLCKLILHGQYSTRELVSKFLIAYFNPATDSEINQILGIFFGAIAARKKQDCLAEALIPSLKTLIDSPYDSPLREVKIETVVKFVVNLTRPVYCSNGLNLHNVLAMKLLEFITENIDDKEVTKVIPKELMTLEISDDPLLRKDMIVKIDLLVENNSLDVKSSKTLKDLKSMLEGTYRQPLKFSSTGTGGQLASGTQPIDEGDDENEIDEFSDVEDEKDAAVEKTIEKPVEVKETPKSQEPPASPVVHPKPCSVNVTLLSDTMLNDVEMAGNESYSTQESISVDCTEVEQVPKKIPVTPKTPSQPSITRRSFAKRQIYTPKTFESPLHKRNSAQFSFNEKTMATPRTPNFTLPNSKISTPNTERQTRSRARAEQAFNTKVTRSQSANTENSAKNDDTSNPKRLSKSQTKK